MPFLITVYLALFAVLIVFKIVLLLLNKYEKNNPFILVCFISTIIINGLFHFFLKKKFKIIFCFVSNHKKKVENNILPFNADIPKIITNGTNVVAGLTAVIDGCN